MAGSQLKQLKEALKSKGLVGQTNVKRKNRKIAPTDTRKDQEEKRREIGKIRNEFNQFDQRFNRSKHDFTVISGGKFVKAGSKQHNASTRTHGSTERAMKLGYEMDRKSKSRVGGMVDRRFGELNKSLTQEEKMLQRFTKEKQRMSKKNVFSLGSEDEYDDDDDGFTLTHSGKTLEFQEDDDRLGLGDAEKSYADDDAQPPRKKSKKDVMAEIIAKSKFHKKQRQMAFERAQEDIMDLDDEFADVMGEINAQPKKAAAAKTAEDIEYDRKVKSLVFERRAVPADRTKTDEELAEEHKEKMKKLEADRMKRMEGLQTGEADADDLDDNFWAGSDSEGEGVAVDHDSDSEQAASDNESADENGKVSRPRLVAIKMPDSYDELREQLEGKNAKEVMAHIKRTIELYHPRLAQGNKDKIDAYVGIVFEHILAVGGSTNPDTKLFNELTAFLRSLAEKYNEALLGVIRAYMVAVEKRITLMSLEKKDLIFFVVLGYCFSTSDHYHLVVTPALVLMNQYLSVCCAGLKTVSAQQAGQGLLICEVLLSYQLFACRYDPEVVAFVEQCAQSLLPEPKNSDRALSGPSKLGSISLDVKYRPAAKSDTLAVADLFGKAKDSNAFKFKLLTKCIALMEKCIATWRDVSASIEILQSFESILRAIARFYATHLPLADILTRFGKLSNNAKQVRKPLTLQEHKKLAIRTLAPKFEENFNPDKKSYDVNRERQEMNKMKSQIKKEKKLALKDIRKQTRFVARQQIEEKKEMYSEYHRKMANIVNSISTVEGAEKNQYEREKKKRQNQK